MSAMSTDSSAPRVVDLDVRPLTGVLGAFLAKGLEATDAAVAAAIAHGLAARAVPHQSGLIASDVVEALPSVLS